STRTEEPGISTTLFCTRPILCSLELPRKSPPGLDRRARPVPTDSGARRYKCAHAASRTVIGFVRLGERAAPPMTKKVSRDPSEWWWEGGCTGAPPCGLESYPVA